MIVQGDVFFVRTRTVPREAKTVNRTSGRIVIAEGEATGHAHVIHEDVELYEKDEVLFIKTAKTVEVRHEEHLPVTLNPGIWKVGIVREYDPFLEETRIVRD